MTTHHILVVDDNPTNLKLISQVLAFDGFDVSEAIDAETAQVMVRDNVPDLILMDIALPGMDGLALTRLLKSDEATKHIRVIALTAFAMKGDEARAREAGCDGYITKPINTRTLTAQLSEILSGVSSTVGVTKDVLY